MVPMDESTFDRVADGTLHDLERAISEADESLEVDLSQGVLTIAFEDGTRFVINSHRAARQIWMAAKSSAWHFDWTGSAWISTKGADELWALVDRLVSEKANRPLGIRPNAR